ncbi:MAG: hypothetical protein ACW974_07010 [Candidatus Thorarchaeota archaeon]|jgi:hypothetical protein
MNEQAWYPCVYEVSTPPAKVTMAGPLFSNVDDTDYQMMFRLPLPLTKGNLRLHVIGCQIGLLGANAANYVSQISVNAMPHLAMKVMFESEEALTAQQMKAYSFAPLDVSSYEAVCVRVWCTVSVPKQLHITSVSLHCYYA